VCKPIGGASWRIGVDPDERTTLVTSGPFAIARNPIFTAMAAASCNCSAGSCQRADHVRNANLLIVL
jgi:protein-S-isoprenylcysteine O-methyltransferase Ste14